MQLLPKQRKDLTTQRVGNEAIVYDEQLHKAFCLNPAAAALWHQCDGATSVEQAAARAARGGGLPVAAETALLAITQFDQEGLLEWVEAGPRAPAQRLTRRRMMGGAVLMMPVLASLLTPRPAEAYSGCAVKVNGICVLSQNAKRARDSGGDE